MITTEAELDKKLEELRYPEQTVFFSGYQMKRRQMIELRDLLKLNILERYDNDEYWDQGVIVEYAKDNNLKGE